MKITNVVVVSVVAMSIGWIANIMPTSILTWISLPLVYIYSFNSLGYKIKLIGLTIAVVCMAMIFFYYEGLRSGYYILFDFMVLIMHILILNSSKIIKMKDIQKSIRIFSIYLAIYVVYYIVAPSNESGRYEGPLVNVNLSAYLFGYSVLLIFMNLAWKLSGLQMITILSFALFLLFFAEKVSGSRSILFFIVGLYMIFLDFAKIKFAKLTIIFVTLLSFLIAGFVTVSLFAGDRFDPEEISFLTRSLIMTDLLNKIIDSQGLPMGPRYAVDFVVNEYNNPDMHPHNDFISGILDYGFIYGLFCILIFKSWFNRYGYNITSLSIFVIYLSSGLHGYFNAFLMFVPTLLVAEYYKNLRKIQHEL